MKISIYKTHMLMVCFMLGTAVSFSQSTNNWSAESYFVAINGADVELVSHFSKGATSITWQQTHGTSVNVDSYTITSITGSWDTQNALGQLDYQLTLDDTTASLSVTGTTDGISFTLALYNTDGSTAASYVFTIDTFTNL